jgi:hypothetical protein
MGGTLDEATFNDMEREARHIVDWYTFNRLKNDTVISNDVKECMYSLIRLVNANEIDLGVQPNSEENITTSSIIGGYSNDGVSVSYNIVSAKDAFDLRQDEVKKTIQMCLSSTMNEAGRKLLYRGLYPNE